MEHAYQSIFVYFVPQSQTPLAYAVAIWKAFTLHPQIVVISWNDQPLLGMSNFASWNSSFGNRISEMLSFCKNILRNRIWIRSNWNDAQCFFYQQQKKMSQEKIGRFFRQTWPHHNIWQLLTKEINPFFLFLLHPLCLNRPLSQPYWFQHQQRLLHLLPYHSLLL